MFKKVALWFAALTLIPGQLPAKGADSPTDLAVLKRPAVVRILTGCEGKFAYKEGKGSGSYSIDTVFTGTGFFISPDGYIATNAHLVDRQSCESGLWARLAENIVRDVRNNPEKVPNALKNRIGLIAFNAGNDSEAMAAIAKELKEYFNSETLKESFKQKGKVQLAGEEFKYVKAYELTEFGKDYEVKKTAEPTVKPQPDYGGKDVAIIKIDGVTAAPTLKLGDSATVREENPVKVIGYPGAADISMKSLPKASITDGKISAIKDWANDVQVLQVDVLVASGSSGSPVLNSNGEVIGMIVGYNRDLSSNDRIPFAIPVNTIKEFVGQAGATVNQESATDKLFQDGLDFLGKQDYHAAEDKFEQVKRSFPQHSEVDNLLSLTQQKRNESVKRQKELMPIILPIAGASGLAVLGIAYFLLRSRSQQHLRLADGVTTGISEPSQTRVESPKVSDFFRRTVVKQPFLDLKNAQGQSHRFYLRKPEHRLGRDRQWADLYLPDQGWEVVSRQHALLQQEETNYRIFDYKSSNRVLVNGVPIPEDGYLLQNDDELKIGYDPKTQVTIAYTNPGQQRSA